MSDLTATNCGCGCDNGCDSGCSGNTSLLGNGSCGCSILWLLILLSLFNNNSSCGNSCDNNGIWIILLLLLFCGGENGCGSIF